MGYGYIHIYFSLCFLGKEGYQRAFRRRSILDGLMDSMGERFEV